MNKILLSVLFTAISVLSYAQVGVGTTDPKAALDIVSTTTGFLMPRFTDHNTLTTSLGMDQKGMQVYNMTTNSLWCWNGTVWFESGSKPTVDGDSDATNEIQSASGVDISDASNNFVATTVEGALTELAIATNTFSPFFVNVSGSVSTSFANTFTTYTHPTVNYDPANAYNPATGTITLPSDGIYQITGTMRIKDFSTAGVQFGVGVHTSNIDGPWFLWHAVQKTTGTTYNRTTYPCIRVGNFSAGDQLRMFVFVDQGPLQMTTAGFQVLKISN